MKTKHLLTALMLPAVFAACTQEEYDVVNNAAGLNERIELGEIKLNMGEADSRFAAGTGDGFNGFVPAEGDVLGAALVDVTGGTDAASVKDSESRAAHMGLYNLTTAINTNYAFTNKGNGVWESEAKMVEGNYLFYLPYNAEHLDRTPLVASLPVIQQLEVTENGVVKESLIDYAIDQKSIMGLGYSFIDRTDGREVSTKMLPIYAYPLVKIVNTYTEDITPNDGVVNPVGVDVTIKQIIVKNSENFTVSAQIVGDKTAATALSAKAGAVKEFTRGFSYVNTSDSKVKVATGSYAAYDVDGEKYQAFTSSLMGENGKVTSPAIVVKPTESLVLESGKDAEFYLVIPAENYADNSLTIEVTTNKGTFAKTIVKPAIAAGKRYPLYEYDENGNLITPVQDPDGSLAIAAGKGAQYCVKLQENTTASQSIMVTTTADLVAELQAAVNEKTLNVTALSKEVCFDAAAATAFKANTNGNFKLIVNGEITITSGLADGTVEGKSVVINDKAYINGDVTIDSRWTWGVTGRSNNYDVVEVVDGNVDIKSMGALHGQMNIKGGTVTVNKNVAAFGVVNGATLNVYSGVDLKSNTGTVNVGKEDAVQTEGISLTWKHSFNNTNGVVNVYKYYSLNKLVNTKTVNNYGTVNGLKNNAAGIVNNYGAVTATSNNGLIDLKDVNASVVATEGGGRIKNNVDINNTINAATMASQKVYFEYKDQTINGALYPTTGQYNTILLDNTTWAPTASQDLTGVNKATLIELKNATVSVYVPGVTITLPDLYVFNGTSTFKGNSEATIEYGAVTKEHNTNAKLNFVGVGQQVVAANSATIEAGIAAGVDVKLDNDVTLGNALTIPAGNKCTIDLNGKTLTTSSSDGDDIVVNGNLTVKNGSITSHNTALFVPVDGGTLTLENCDVTTDHSAYAAVAAFGGELVITGGNYKNSATTAANDGSAHYVIGVKNADATLTNVSVSSNVQGGLTVLGNSSVDIDGGSYTAGEYAVSYEKGLFVNAGENGNAVVNTSNNAYIETFYYKKGVVNGMSYSDNVETNN